MTNNFEAHPEASSQVTSFDAKSSFPAGITAKKMSETSLGNKKGRILPAGKNSLPKKEGKFSSLSRTPVKQNKTASDFYNNPNTVRRKAGYKTIVNPALAKAQTTGYSQ